MIRIRKLNFVLVVTMFLAGIFTSVIANDNYPFKFAGIVDSIDSNQIVLSDKALQLSSELNVYGSTGLTLLLKDIKQGDKVGCNFIKTDSGEIYITELYKLSDRFNLKEYGYRFSVLYAN